jgi:hypothetical protein
MSDKKYIRFSNSNSLRVIRLQDYDLDQSDTTRLYYDFVYTSISNNCYFNKIKKSNGIWVQFSTSYDNISAYIVDENYNKTDVSAFITQGVGLTNDRYQYQLTVDLSAYSGYYCLMFDFIDYNKPLANYQSEWFEIADSFDDCLKIEWKNGSFNPYNDGIIWGGSTQCVYIESHLVDFIPGIDKTVFKTENNKLLTTQANPIKSKKWVIELIPDYIVEMINLALAHDYFYINGVRYNSEEVLEAERQGETRLYSSNMVLTQVEDVLGNAYEDYINDIELTGAIPVIADFALFAGTGLALFAGTGLALGYYTSQEFIESELSESESMLM